MKDLICPIRQHSLTDPSAPAVVSGPVSVTYRDLDALVTRYEKKLKAKGIKRGDRFAILPEASLQTIVRLFAVWRVGGIVCFLNPRLPRKELNTLARRMICAWSFCSRLSKIPGLSLRLSVPKTWTPLGKVSMDIRCPATMIPTSGSTGAAKIVAHSLANHFQSAAAANQNIPVKKGDIWLLSLPLYHVSGLSILFRAFSAGGAVMTANRKQPLGQILRKNPLTHVSLVATQLFRLLQNNREKDLRRLKCILLGGSAIPPGLIKKSRGKKLPVYLTYGLTETASQVASTPRYDPRKTMPNLRALKNVQIKIKKDGEILIKSPAVCLGYWNGRAVRPAADTAGWLHTGDIGEIREGELTVLGRRDSMFISGGENIYPEEIERRLMDIEEIERAVVLPAASREFGRRPQAFLKTTRPITIERIREALKEHLPKFKIPDAFYAWPVFREKGIKIQRPDFVEFLKTEKIKRLR